MVYMHVRDKDGLNLGQRLSNFLSAVESVDLSVGILAAVQNHGGSLTRKKRLLVQQ